MSRRAVHVRIAGRVQGVSFRYWTLEEATRLRLDGWVRNHPDSSVEAVFAGSSGGAHLKISFDVELTALPCPFASSVEGKG